MPTATAIVGVKDKFVVTHLLRAAVDGCSDGAFATEKDAQLLNLPQKKEHIPLTGIDDMPLGKVKKSVKINVQSLVESSIEMKIDALVVRSIMTPKRINASLRTNSTHLCGLKLADPQYFEANEVDLLFGVDIYGIILRDGLRKGKYNEPIGQNSELGWLVFGAVGSNKSVSVIVIAVFLGE